MDIKEVKKNIGNKFFEIMLLNKLKKENLINEECYCRLRKEIDSDYKIKGVMS